MKQRRLKKVTENKCQYVLTEKKVSVGIMISKTEWRADTYPKRMVQIDDTKIPITSMNFAPI